MSAERLDALRKQQEGTDTVLEELKKGQLVKSEDGKILGKDAVGWPVFFDEDSNVMMSVYEPGGNWPMHEHGGIDELLTVTKGEFVITVRLPEGDITFCLKRGQSFKVPPGVIHSVMTLLGGKMIAVCVPPEKGYVECLKKP